MEFFKSIAGPLQKLGIPVIPLQERSKAAFIADWEKLATTASDKLDEWSLAYPNSNVGCVAEARVGGLCIWESDSPEVIERIEKKYGQKVPRTRLIASSPGKHHRYWSHTAKSLAVGNIAQGAVNCKDWSFRADRQYVVGPGSIHPKTGEPYAVIDDYPIQPIPDWLVEAFVNEYKQEKQRVHETPPTEIAEGGRNTALTSVAGAMRRTGLERDALLAALLVHNTGHCVPPLDDSEVEQIVDSVCRYETEGLRSVIIGNRVIADGQEISRIEVTAVPEPAIEIEVEPYPKFPVEIFEDTTVYEGFAKPWADLNTRPPEWMLVPAIAIECNWLSTRVEIKDKNYPLSFYNLLVGPPGTGKSSCIADTCDYYGYMGFRELYTGDTRLAEGKVLSFSAGSGEGVGIAMQKTNCKNALLHWDELESFKQKCLIEGSTLKSKILTIYEAGDFDNNVTDAKKRFALAARSYCISLMCSCTLETFGQLWGGISGGKDGLEDRFTIILAPESSKELSTLKYVNTRPAAQFTKARMEQAAAQHFFEFDDPYAFDDALRAGLRNRAVTRAEKVAFWMAVELGLSSISPDCCDRGLQFGWYEQSVKEYLEVCESKTLEAQLCNQMISVLRRAPGHRMEWFAFLDAINYDAYGPTIFKRAYRGMLEIQRLREQQDGSILWVCLHRVPQKKVTLA